MYEVADTEDGRVGMTEAETTVLTALETLIALWDRGEIDVHYSADLDEIERAFTDARNAATLLRGGS